MKIELRIWILCITVSHQFIPEMCSVTTIQYKQLVMRIDKVNKALQKYFTYFLYVSLFFFI